MAWKRRVINLILLRCRPSGTALLDWLAPRVDDSMLREIAASDYGNDERDHLRALRLARDHGDIPVPLRWVPREVLELTRWSEPDETNPATRYGSPGTRGHLIRAFCCAVLVRAADEPETRDYISSENDSLAQLVASALALGRDASEATVTLLAWRLLRPWPYAEEYPFFALGLLLLRAALYEPGETDVPGQGQGGPDLAALADWVVREEARARRTPTALVWSEEWLLGLTCFDQCHAVWQRLAQEILLDPTTRFPEPAASGLRGITRRLVP